MKHSQMKQKNNTGFKIVVLCTLWPLELINIMAIFYIAQLPFICLNPFRKLFFSLSLSTS